MNNDASWDRITDAIDLKYGLKDHGRLSRPVADGHHLTESVSFVSFDREGTTYRLERVTGPAIIDRKSFGARRIGADVRFENVYDPDEISHKTLVYKQDGDGWTAIDASELGL